MNCVILNNYLGSSPSKDEVDNLDETKAIKKALEELKFKVSVVPFSFNLKETMEKIKRARPEFVFNLVESIEGKDSLAYFAPAILDSMGIPYTGCQTEAMYKTASKVTTKKILHSAGILTPQWASLKELSNKKSIFGKKYIIIKHLWEHASEDIDDSSVFQASDIAKLNESLRKRKNIESYFAEEFIDGREFNVSILEQKSKVKVLPPAEMTFLNYPKGKFKIIDYKAKWEEDSFEYKNTVRSFNFEKKDKALLKSLKEISEKTWNHFELNGYARVDFRVNKKGQPYVLEINSNPCISPDSGFVAACKKEGMNYKEMISKIIEGVH